MIAETPKQLQKVNKTVTHKNEKIHFFYRCVIEGLWLIPVLITLFKELRSKKKSAKNSSK
jgi:hypothetical protein